MNSKTSDPSTSPVQANEERKGSLADNYEAVINERMTKLELKGTSPTSLKDFSCLKVLGTGNYGKVILVRHKKTDRLYAMKVLKQDMIRKRNQVEHTMTERRILERIKHPFVVRMKYAFKDNRKLYFVLDYCPGGELFFYLLNLRKFKQKAVCFYAANILLALKELHELDIIYRDLKPENILIDLHGFAMLTDFGLSKENMTNTSRAKSFCGTAEYLAPEVLEKERAYGKECDWWSFGCVVYEMLTGHPPFYCNDRSQMFEEIKQSEVQFYKFHSSEARDLLRKLLTKDPKKRLADPKQIMQHAFFGGVDWDAMLKRAVVTPYKPRLQDPTDTSHFDREQTDIPILSPSPKKDQEQCGLQADNSGDFVDVFNSFHFSPAPSQDSKRLSESSTQLKTQAIY